MKDGEWSSLAETVLRFVVGLVAGDGAGGDARAGGAQLVPGAGAGQRLFDAGLDVALGLAADGGERVVSMALVDSTRDNGRDGAAVEDLELIAQS